MRMSLSFTLTEDTSLYNFICSLPLYSRAYTMCGSKNYPYLPHGRDFSLDPTPPLWKFMSSFIHQKFPLPSVGGVWIFSGTTQSCKDPEFQRKFLKGS